MYEDKKFAERLATQTVRNGDCLEWTGTRSVQGYGQIHDGRKRLGAHRIAWEIANDSSIPDGLMILHSCDNPPCCNPAHLRVGDAADNTRDMLERGRHRAPPMTEARIAAARARKGRAAAASIADDACRRAAIACGSGDRAGWVVAVSSGREFFMPDGHHRTSSESRAWRAWRRAAGIDVKRGRPASGTGVHVYLDAETTRAIDAVCARRGRKREEQIKVWAVQQVDLDKHSDRCRIHACTVGEPSGFAPMTDEQRASYAREVEGVAPEAIFGQRVPTFTLNVKMPDDPGITQEIQRQIGAHLPRHADETDEQWTARFLERARAVPGVESVELVQP